MITPIKIDNFANGLPSNSIIEYKHIQGEYTYSEALKHEGEGFTIASLKDVYTFNNKNIFFGTFWCKEVYEHGIIYLVYAMRLSISDRLTYPVFMLPNDRIKLLMVKYSTVQSRTSNQKE